MKRLFVLFIVFFVFITNLYSQDEFFQPDDLFHLDHMDSHNKEFSLYFKGREKSILARGENENYINDYPKDLYIYNHLTKSSSPLISYEWFPSRAKYLLQEYDFPVFPDDFAYYLLKDDKTLVMISAVKSLNANFKYDITSKKSFEGFNPNTGLFLYMEDLQQIIENLDIDMVLDSAGGEVVCAILGNSCDRENERVCNSTTIAS